MKCGLSSCSSSRYNFLKLSSLTHYCSSFINCVRFRALSFFFILFFFSLYRLYTNPPKPTKIQGIFFILIWQIRFKFVILYECICCCCFQVSNLSYISCFVILLSNFFILFMNLYVVVVFKF